MIRQFIAFPGDEVTLNKYENTLSASVESKIRVTCYYKLYDCNFCIKKVVDHIKEMFNQKQK